MRAIEDQESDSTIALMLSILNSYKCRSLWSQSHALVDGFHITYKHRKPPWSPLFYACASRLHGISKALLDSGVDPNESNEPYGTALHKSLSMGFPRIMQLLLERGADPATQNREGHCMLYSAAKQGNVAAVKLLLEHRVNPQSTKGRYGTALKGALAGTTLKAHHAGDVADFENVVYFLLAKGAEVPAFSVCDGVPFHINNRKELIERTGDDYRKLAQLLVIGQVCALRELRELREESHENFSLDHSLHKSKDPDLSWNIRNWIASNDANPRTIQERILSKVLERPIASSSPSSL
ncbi:ankyrin repeat-containing domain protein [Halenospora varia]|nr:ankyrin repeat-containing domain protein [Halenospora varia]